MIRNLKNEGFARGNNVGFAAARGEWMFLLNSDAVCPPEVIGELMAFAAGKPDVGQLACRVVQADQPHFYDSAGLLLYPDGIARPRGWQEKDQGNTIAPKRCWRRTAAPARCARPCSIEIGGFDEDFFCYFEDLDLGMRGQLAGWKCWYVPTTRGSPQEVGDAPATTRCSRRTTSSATASTACGSGCRASCSSCRRCSR